MNILRLAAASTGGVKTSHNFSHNIVQGSEAGFIDKFKAAARDKIEGYKDQARRERETKQVLQMSDSMLKDIGLTHTDRNSLNSGLISLVELNARREAYRRQFN